MSDVLFVCVHNAGRSQMAKALFNHMAQERGLSIRAESVGTEPAEYVQANVVEAMKELGIDLASEKPQLLTNEMVEKAKRVITMGCAVDSKTCPAIFLRNAEDWGLPNPAGKSLDVVCAIRDAILKRVERLISELS